MDRLARALPAVLRWITGLGAGAFILCALAIGITRSAWPWPLEWMEGGSLQQVERLRSGLPLYAPPTVEHTPFLYTPLYFELGALLPADPSSPFLPLRLLSLGAWSACLLLIVQLVRRWTGSLWWGLFGAGVYAGCLEAGGAWFDLARVDNLSLALLLGGWLALEMDHGGRAAPPWRQVLGALLLCGSFLAKQSVLPVVLLLAVHALATGRGYRRWLFPGIAFLGISGLVVWYNQQSGGWFNYYVFELPASHALEPGALAGFWRFDLLAPLPFLLAATLLAGIQALYTRQDRTLAWLGTLFLAFVGSAWLGRLHTGGYLNVLLPAYAFLAVWGARSLHHLLDPAFDDPFTAFRRLTDENTENLRHSLVLLVCLLQLALLVYDPRDHLPRPGDRAPASTLKAWIGSQQGELWLPTLGWLVPPGSSHGAAHEMALLDVLRGPAGPARENLDQQIRSSLESGRWSAVVLDRPWYAAELASRYAPVPAPLTADRMPTPLTGMETRPVHFLRRSAAVVAPPDSLAK